MKAGDIVRRCSVDKKPTGPFLIVTHPCRTQVTVRTIGALRLSHSVVHKQHIHQCKTVYVRVDNETINSFVKCKDRSSVDIKYTKKIFNDLTDETVEVVVLMNSHLNTRVYLTPLESVKMVKQRWKWWKPNGIALEPYLYIKLYIGQIIAIEL